MKQKRDFGTHMVWIEAAKVSSVFSLFWTDLLEILLLIKL